MDYLMGFDAVDLKVLGYEHPQYAVFDAEATKNNKEIAE
jgi:hypothetical protein